MEGGWKWDSWPPSTPLKDIMQMIDPEMQENEVEWMGLGRRMRPGLGKEVFVDEFEALEGVAFSDLLGLADVATAEGNGGIGGQSCISIPNTASSFNSMLLSGHNFVPGSTLQFNGNCTTGNNDLSVPHQRCYDLNFPPDMEGNAVSSLDIARFAPTTPVKPGNSENDQVAEIQNLHLCEQRSQERNDNEGPSQLVTDSSGPAVSTPLKDNQNSDEGGNKKIDLNRTTQQKPRRRKHRPKIAIEGKKPKQASKPVTSKSGGSKDNLRVKRKYVRRKGVNKTTNLLGESSGVVADSETLQPPRNTCRRALDFNTQEQQCGSSAPKPISNLDSESRVQSKSSVQVSQQTELIVENMQAGFAYDLTCSVNQVLSTPFQMNTNTSEEILDGDQVTVHDKQEGIANNMLENKNQTALGSANDTIHSTGAGLNGVQARRSKRKCSHVIEQASNTNRNGAHYNNLQAYEHLMHFPNICKKKRSEKGQKLVTSYHLNEMNSATPPPKMCSDSNAKAYPFAAKADYWSSSPPQLTTSQVPAILRKSGREGLEAKQRTKLYLMALTEPERLTNTASTSPTRVYELASMNRSAVCQVQTTSSAKQGSVGGIKNLQKLHTCTGDLVADMQQTVAKRKRSKKRNSFTGICKTQLHQQIVLHKTQQFSTELSGADAKVRWQGFIDVITERLKYLDINSGSDRVIFQERDALVPYNQDQNAFVPYNQDQNAFVPYNQDQSALVLYRSDGSIVPFQGPFNPIKNKRPRPKVDLDEETNRVFQLLLENINNEGIDGTDEEKRKWWEEERRVFCGRADSFVARMHLVQGDRRFSLWKGSVLDSVVGVFLTQNVTDHLSSSAFLSLAARFPLKSKSNQKPLHEEETTLLVKEAEVCIPDPDSEQITEWKENTSNQRVSDQSSMTFHDNEYNEEKEVVSSNVSPGNKTAEVSLTEKINCSSITSSESDVETYQGPTTKITRTETANFAQFDVAANDLVSSQNSLNSFQSNVEHPIAQTSEGIESCSEANSEAEKLKNRLQVNNLNDSTSSMDLLRMAGSTMLHEVSKCKSENGQCDRNSKDIHSSSDQSIVTAESTSPGTFQEKVTVTVQESSTSYSENNQSCNLQGDENMIQSQNWFAGDANAETLARGLNNKEQETLNLPNLSGETLDITENTISDKHGNKEQKKAENKALKEINSAKDKSRRVGREINHEFEWDTLRREAEANGKKERLSNTMDSLDWEAVRCADVNEIAETIKERGMNNVLAARIKAFLNRVVSDHGSLDLEWLRDIEADKAKEYLLSIRGLGLKSVECVRLLTLQHLAFPVDTNVGRIAVRLGWVPLQPLPDSLQLHLLELYPVMESIQRYLWPRLCKLKQEELYELHYQMITFGKVFCTKTKPNCNACPMRGECRHFASAFASGRLALPAPEEKSIVSVPEKTADPDTTLHINALSLPPPQAIQELEASLTMDRQCVVGSCEPIIEQPASPETESTQYQECDMEDSLYDDSDDIPTIKLNIEEFTQNLQHYMKDNMQLQEGEMSKALVALTLEAASIPMPKLKNVSRLRTEHQVYELPDSHPLLEGMDKREPDDPCTYLLAIWAPGETANSIQPPEGRCSYQESGKLCDQETCFVCNSIREANSQMVRGTILMPCRTAARGRFPLNGTYFQVNEVFADHASSLNPINIPRQWLWNLPRKTVFFGTSVSSIFKGLSTEEIQHCFWRGHVCVRGFDHKTRAPRPLVSRLHSSLTKAKGKTVDE